MQAHAQSLCSLWPGLHLADRPRGIHIRRLSSSPSHPPAPCPAQLPWPLQQALTSLLLAKQPIVRGILLPHVLAAPLLVSLVLLPLLVLQ